MYATILRCTLPPRTATDARWQRGRTLTTALAALPGFVACVALDAEGEPGVVVALCLVEEQANMAAAERVIAAWQHEQGGAAGTGIACIGQGAVIAQKGL
jgi:hypothetical protein